jgi:HAD superfamily hydrolase (TIGR01549 family)
MIKAITFDFWDCIAVDDSDEPKRKAAGLPTKSAARAALFTDEVLAHHPEIGLVRAAAAYAETERVFRHHWKVEHHTPSVAERLAVGFADLDIQRTPSFDALVESFSMMEVRIPPDVVPDAPDVIRALSGRYPLGIISDAIVTPGVGLRQLLDSYGILDCFSHFVFSDEAGAAKPARKVFDLAAAGLDTPLDHLVHIGDRESNDIVGPRDAGAHAILITASIDRGQEGTRANAVCERYVDLPSIIASL